VAKNDVDGLDDLNAWSDRAIAALIDTCEGRHKRKLPGMPDSLRIMFMKADIATLATIARNLLERKPKPDHSQRVASPY
jgi:hypothetical protein